MMKIEIEVDEEQLGILLSNIEGLFDIVGDRTRRPELVDEALERAAETWTLEGQSNEYEIARMAPVYRQLVRHWKKKRTRASMASAAESAEEFHAALDVARPGSSRKEVAHA